MNLLFIFIFIILIIIYFSYKKEIFCDTEYNVGCIGCSSFCGRSSSRSFNPVVV